MATPTSSDVVFSWAVFLLFFALNLYSGAALFVVPQVLKSVGYLGRGYDMMKGNPQTIPKSSYAGPDPGYRSPIFQLDNYSDLKVTPDGVYLLPNGVYAAMCNSCSMETTTSTVHGATSYSDAIHGYVKFNAGLPMVASFSASVDFKVATEKTVEHSKILIQSHALCCIYHAQFLQYSPPRLHDNFLIAVRNLPLSIRDDSEKEMYRQFIDEFGTHYVDDALFGGRAGRENQMTSEKFSEFLDGSVDVEVAANVDMKKVSVGVEVVASYEREIASSFESNVESTTNFNYGGEPTPGVDSIEEALSLWFKSATEKPMPIHYNLNYVTEVLNHRHFPDDDDIEVINANVKIVIEEYCEYLLKKGELTLKSCNHLIDAPLPDVWEVSGVGSPTTSQPYTHFDRVGGVCAFGDHYHKILAGISFARGGCHTSGDWTQGRKDFDRCDAHGETDSEGLLLRMLCAIVPTTGSAVWRGSGTGSPVNHFTDFSRVGVTCLKDEVMTGLRFRRGGCRKTLQWTQGVRDYHSCGISGGQEGLLAEARCIKLKYGYGASRWYDSGVGTPIKNNAFFDRVGGRCPAGEFANGVKFKVGGCGEDFHWSHGKHNYDVCPQDRKNEEGLVLVLNCVTPNTPGGDVGVTLWTNQTMRAV